MMDRARLDFERLFGLHEAGAFFVSRAESNADIGGVMRDDSFKRMLIFWKREGGETT